MKKFQIHGFNSRVLALSLLLITSFSIVDNLHFDHSTPFTLETNAQVNIQKRIFYIDRVNGNDEWSGTLPTPNNEGIDGPWRSLTRIDNVDTFLPGDNILMKRGGQWNITREFSFISDGSDENSIYLGAYGKGPNPILDGSTGVDTFLRFTGSYYSLDNWSIQNTQSYGFIAENPNIWCHDITLTNLNFNNTGRDGIYFSRFQGVSDLLISNCFFNNSGRLSKASSIAILGGSPHHSFNIEIRYNTILNTNGDALTTHEGASNPEQYLGSNISIHNNYIHTSTDDGLDLTTGSGVYVYNNTVIRAGQSGIWVAHTVHDVYIYNNLLFDSGDSWGMVIIQSPDVSFYNNEVQGNGVAPYLLLINDRNPNSGVDVDNISIYKNTFVNSGDSFHGAPIEIANEDGGLGSIYFYDNIVSTKLSSMPNYVINFIHNTYRADDPDFHCDGNIYGPGEARFFSNGMGKITWPDWCSLYGHDTSGKNTDPVFKDRIGGDYHLSYLSPCIDRTVFGLSDFVGTDRSGGIIYGERDIGAYEHQPNNQIGVNPIVGPATFIIYSNGMYRYSEDITKMEDAGFSIIQNSSFSVDIDDHVIDRLVSINVYTDQVDERTSFAWSEDWENDPISLEYQIEFISSLFLFNIFMENILIDTIRPDGNDSFTFSMNQSIRERNFAFIREDSPYLVHLDRIDSCNTGDLINITLDAYDDDGVEFASIEYWFGSGKENNMEELLLYDGTAKVGSWFIEIQIPSNSISSLNYFLYIRDAEGHYFRSETVTTIIIDNIPPLFIIELSEKVGTIGTEHIFIVDILDNIQVRNVTIFFHDPINFPSERMILKGNFQIEIELPKNYIGEFPYSYTAFDTSGNMLETEIFSINVIDDGIIEIFHTNSTYSWLVDSFLEFDFRVIENMGISNAKIKYWYGAEIPITLILEGNNSLYYVKIPLEEDFKGMFYYYFTANDIFANEETSKIFTTNITANVASRITSSVRYPKIDSMIIGPMIFQISVEDQYIFSSFILILDQDKIFEMDVIGSKSNFDNTIVYFVHWGFEGIATGNYSIDIIGESWNKIVSFHTGISRFYHLSYSHDFIPPSLMIIPTEIELDKGYNEKIKVYAQRSNGTTVLINTTMVDWIFDTEILRISDQGILHVMQSGSTELTAVVVFEDQILTATIDINVKDEDKNKVTEKENILMNIWIIILIVLPLILVGSFFYVHIRINMNTGSNDEGQDNEQSGKRQLGSMSDTDTLDHEGLHLSIGNETNNRSKTSDP